MLHKLVSSLACGIYIFLTCSTAQGSDCNEPNLRCLSAHIEADLQRLHASQAIQGTTLQQWQFESRHWYQHKPASAEIDASIQQLLKEEAFIQDLHSGHPLGKPASSTALHHPFQDLLGADSNLLLIQHLTLDLRDQAAEQIKRQQLEAHWSTSSVPNQVLINISLQEILGGNPKRGLATLANTDLTEFSDIRLLTELSTMQLLGAEAGDLFLNPAAINRNCEQDEQLLLQCVQRFYSDAHQQLLNGIWNTPDLDQAWKGQFALTLLYKNAGACSLFITLHKRLLIQSAINSQPESEQDMLNLIFLFRALRRYLPE